MLKPAILYKDQITQLSYALAGTADMFFYSGWSENDIIRIDAEAQAPYERRQFASLNTKGELIGYIAYTIDHRAHCVFQFGLMSFRKGSITLLRDLDKVLEDLIKNPNIHRIEWRMIGGNFVEATYDKFCFKHGGNKLIVHDVVVDVHGEYHDEAIYEIIKGDLLAKEGGKCHVS